MARTHQCGYCLISRPTAQGIRSHISQSRECANALKARNALSREVAEPEEDNAMAVDQSEDDNPEAEAPTTDVDEVQAYFDGGSNLDPPRPSTEPELPQGTTPDPTLLEHHRRGVEMEEVEDEDNSNFCWVADY